MKTSFDMLDIIYPILAQPTTITSVINGGVYRSKKPLNSQYQDIVIKPLGLGNSDGVVVQTGTFFINIFCKDFDNGRPDEANLKTITDTVINTLEAYNNTSGSYFYFEIINQTAFQDHDDPVMSYVSLRVRYTIQK